MELGYHDFTQLMAWLGPEALRTHIQYPRGQRYFDTESRTFRFNIDPNDYFEITPGVEGVSPPKAERVVPAAYHAMRAVIDAAKAKSVKFRIVRVSWAAGGSYIEATFPRKREEPPVPEVCPVCHEEFEYDQEEVCDCDLL